MKKEHRKPQHALLPMGGDQTLYNPCTTGHGDSINHTLLFHLFAHFLLLTIDFAKDSVFSRIEVNCVPMDLLRIVGGVGLRIVPRLAVLGFLISASVSFASWLGAGSLFRVCGVLKGEEGKNEKKMVARQGRQLQRYSSCGRRLVVGCIPYKLKMGDPCTEDIDELVQVLVISSQKGHGMMFPKGGWESDETIKQAVSREALEEAGVNGDVESKLGSWMYKSNRFNVLHEGIMFPLNVKEELLCWPEMEVRKRRWVSVAEAREGCQHVWMIEALELLLRRLRQQNSNA